MNDALEPDIRSLDESVINHIAAGEVVERPASVVKELLENALDARGTEIAVAISEGGCSEIRVTDNGCGIAPKSLKIALQRHATSKIKHQDDLTRLTTLGFRGEALSSIAAVSRLTITSRRSQDEVATRMITEGGRILKTTSVAAPFGTEITVSDLFFNTTPRRKFLRAHATEQAHVVQAVLRVALGAREGSFVLTAQNRTLLRLTAAERAEARILRALGAQVGPLEAVVAHDDGLAVTGFVSAPATSKRTGGGMWIFVNGRFVRDRMLQRAILEASGATESAAFCAVIFLDLLPDTVDVNVHPQKLEVRFGDSARIYRTVGRAVAEARAFASGPPKDAPSFPSSGGVVRATQSFFEEAQSIPARGAIHLRSGSHLTPNHGSRLRTTPLSVATEKKKSEASSQTSQGHQLRLEMEEPAFSQLTPLALMPPGFLTLAQTDTLMLIDLTAAFRQLVLDELPASASSSRVKVKSLILPVTFAVLATEAADFEEVLPFLLRWGFDIRRVGRLAFCLCGAPSLWSDIAVRLPMNEVVKICLQYAESATTDSTIKRFSEALADVAFEPVWGESPKDVYIRLCTLLADRNLTLLDLNQVATIDTERAFKLAVAKKNC